MTHNVKTNILHGYHLALALALVMPLGNVAWEDTCTPFHKIYEDGKELCETIFGDAFVYEINETLGYSMWWFAAGNPNDATTAALNSTVPSTCELEYFHKSGSPTAEDANFTECHPWQQSACCYESTVTTSTALNEAYGAGYEWDRCGTMSEACERFFVQEACLYECDVNAGLYRKCSDAMVEAAAGNESDPCYGNTWEMYQMPIKASYCNAWFDACYEDEFCGTGNFFGCAAYYSSLQVTASPTVTKTTKTDIDDELPMWAKATIGVFAAILVVCAIVFVFTVHKERSGDPLFKPLNTVHEKSDDVTESDIEFRN